MSDKHAGEPAGSGSAMLVNRPVFFTSALLIVGFSLFGILFPDSAEALFSGLQEWVLHTFGWFYMLAVVTFLVFCIFLAASPLGRVKLGPDHSEPAYSYPSWFAMLFSAGMGIGLMFFGVAEPVLHFTDPPVGEGGTVDSARQAMSLTFFHWGVHAWAIYAVVGLALAYFSFRHGLPLTIRSALYPLIGDRIHGPIGHVVDIFAVVATMFGLATSLGLGVMQINAGLSYLLGAPDSVMLQVVLIAVITAIATLSVVSGLDAGIRRLSEFNIALAFGLLLFVVLAGPTAFLLSALVQNTGTYLSDIVLRSFYLYAYEPNDWLGGWTLFYWAWWIAWSPFVGMFIARISRGRTIREFVVGVLLVPFGVTAIWFTAFGNTAIGLDLGGVTDAVSTAAGEDASTALFVFLQQLPLSGLTSVLATILVVVFFVTSSDSGSLVIDTITAGGREDGPVWQRIFWACSEGVVAAVLLLAGGLAALQAASLIAALPFAAIMLFVCYGLWRGLQLESARARSETLPSRPAFGESSPVAWRQRLAHLLDYPQRAEVIGFFDRVVEPALRDVAGELAKTGLEVKLDKSEDRVVLEVASSTPANDTFRYAVRARAYDVPEFAYRDLPRVPDTHKRYYRAEVYLVQGGRNYDVMGYAKEHIISDVLTQYERHLHVLEQVAP